MGRQLRRIHVSAGQPFDVDAVLDAPHAFDLEIMDQAIVGVHPHGDAVVVLRFTIDQQTIDGAVFSGRKYDRILSGADFHIGGPTIQGTVHSYAVPADRIQMFVLPGRVHFQGQILNPRVTDMGAGIVHLHAPLIGRLRTSLQWSPERILTFVIDRGIYSNRIFSQVLADPAIHLITWKKGYQATADTPWETLSDEHKAAGTYGSHTFNRQRNNASDHRAYQFEDIHRPWSKNPAIRQIIVRATNPQGRTEQLPVLTDDTTTRP